MVAFQAVSLLTSRHTEAFDLKLFLFTTAPFTYWCFINISLSLFKQIWLRTFFFSMSLLKINQDKTHLNKTTVNGWWEDG